MGVLIIFVALIAVTQTSAFKIQSQSRHIISGTEAKVGEAPYIVSLKTTSHFCAGSIIDANWVLTAAHCLIYDSFRVVAGLHNRNDQSQVQIRSVQKRNTIVHTLYIGTVGVGPNDIGLIYVETPFDFSELSRITGKPLVSKIKLPSRQFSQFGKGQVFGWGYDNTKNLPYALQKLDTNIITYAECKNLLPLNSKIAPSNICSYNDGTIASFCNGDSGGPLVKHNGNLIELIGIVSWGYTPCTATSHPSIYTHTDAFASWITQQQRNFVWQQIKFRFSINS